MSKNLVLSFSIGQNSKAVSDLTFPAMMSYANSVGADFDYIKKESINAPHIFFQKFQISDYLDVYDRVFYLDADCLITPNCPNVFDYYDSERLTAYLESSIVSRSMEIINAQKALGDIVNKRKERVWTDFYFNAGVMLVSRSHQNLFNKNNLTYVSGMGDQCLLNHRAMSLLALDKLMFTGMSSLFNMMDVCLKDRFTANIIHYAGDGYAKLEGFSNKLNVIENDILRLY